ncbi:GapR family DNA-binding domain-containing protein [Caulobacter sp. RHG1]|uniref:GapR family DNA-binding domain-containing protein n=1 Tax=Caulobacter sp. (strain RHG1) TaxID=2545762 RepID=UPI00351BC4BD|nr:DNA translocase FtsK [Caulobacter sp. RHG1]
MADDAVPHSDVLGSNAQSQLKSIVERLERLAVEKAEIAEQEKEVLLEAKGNGYCTKTIKKVIARRKIERAKLQEQEAMIDLYESALDGLPLFEAAEPKDGNGGIATVTLTMGDGSAVAATPDQMAVAMATLDGKSTGQALYEQAVAIVKRDRKASISYLQRKLQLNFDTASNLMSLMEETGVVGPPDRAGKREILVQAEAA